MRAWNLTRREIVYRHDAFSAGLRAAGYEIQGAAPRDFRPGDVVLGWHRYGANIAIADTVERAGGVYICGENGYLAPGGGSPHDQHPRQWFALACGWHNDAGTVRMGTDDRWSALGVTLQPWRACDAGGHILVAANRPFGAPGRAMPAGWPQDVAARLAKLTKREIRIRPHPGNAAPHKPLTDDLAGAWCTVIWSSSAGVHSLIAGVPVIAECPFWICKGAAFDSATSSDIIIPAPTAAARRLNALHLMSHGQFSVDEIAAGEPFRRLLA